MKKFSIVAAAAAISAMTVAPLAAGTIDDTVEEEDPFVAPAGSSANLGALAAIGGGLILICAIACDSDSSSTTTSAGDAQ